MKHRIVYLAFFTVVGIALTTVGVVRLRSSDVGSTSTAAVPSASTQVVQPVEPPESIFDDHSYVIPDYYEFARADESIPPAVSRDEMIATIEANLAPDSGATIASVDLVDVVRSPYMEEATSPFKSRHWLVVLTNAVTQGVSGGQPGSSCDVPFEEKPASCLPSRYKGTLISLYDAETGELTASDFDGERLQQSVGVE